MIGPLRFRRFAKLLLAGAISLASLLDAEPAASSEVAGNGDFQFYLDSAAFRGLAGRILEEVYLRIPNDEIKFKPHGDGFQARIKISVQMTGIDGKPVIQDAREMTFFEENEEEANNPLFFQTVINRYQVDPGVYFLSCALEDLEAPKMTVLGMVRGQQKTSLVRNLRLELPGVPDDYPSFSQPKYLWSIEHQGDETIYHPNPPRMYGLYKDSLFVYLELYLPDSLAQEPTFELKSYLLDDGEVVKETAIDIPNPGMAEGLEGLERHRRVKTYPIVIQEDLTELSAGSYSLLFTFGLEGRILTRVRGGAFSVAWDMRTWEVPRRSYLAEARFLLGDEEYATFVDKPIGEQERFLEKMWKTHDPAPETSENEAYNNFLVRLAYVYDQFSGDGDPVFSDRGQTYLRFGAPDEVIQDVLPVNRETINEAIQKLEDRFHTINYSTHGVKPYSGAVSRDNISDPRGIGRIGEGGNVGYPYELWVYNGSGKPILARDRTMDPEIGMRYLFIDREGYGRYQLESSSAISSK